MLLFGIYSKIQTGMFFDHISHTKGSNYYIWRLIVPITSDNDDCSYFNMLTAINAFNVSLHRIAPHSLLTCILLFPKLDEFLLGTHNNILERMSYPIITLTKASTLGRHRLALAHSSHSQGALSQVAAVIKLPSVWSSCPQGQSTYRMSLR